MEDNGAKYYGFSYQNFPSEVVLEGHQAAYNAFIQNDTDAIFFVLNGTGGNRKFTCIQKRMAWGVLRLRKCVSA